MTDHNDTGAAASSWSYEIQYGPNDEKIYAWVYNHNLMVCTVKVHHARLIVEAVNAYEPLKARLAEVERERDDIRSTLNAWFNTSNKLEPDISKLLLDGLNGYIRRSESGGMPFELADDLRAVIEDFCRLYVGNLLTPYIERSKSEARALAASRPAMQVVDREAVARIIKNHVSVTVSGNAYAPRDNDRDGVASAADAILSLLRPAEPVENVQSDIVAQRTWFDGENIRTENLTADDIYQKPTTPDAVGEPVAWDHRVLCACENCTEYAPENSVFAREDIGVMPDGTWLCENCYSDCEKTAYGMVANDSDDFEYPRFEDLPRPSLYTHPPKSPDISAAVLAERERCASEVRRLTKKWGNPNGTAYEQGAQDHGHRLDAAIRQLPTSEQGDK